MFSTGLSREPTTFTTTERACTTLTGRDVGGRGAEAGSYNDFLLLFDKATGTTKVQYMVIDSKGKRKRLVPKLNTISIPKVKDVCGYRVMILDGFMYMLGGKHVQSDAYLSHVFCFNPRNNQWTRRSNMKRARHRFTATALDGYIYVCGGEVRGGKISDSVECYDPVTDSWTDMRPMPRPLADHAACVAEGRVFVSGGISERRGGTNGFWQYEPFSDFWSLSHNQSLMPTGRERHCMISYMGTIYVFGGMSAVKQDSGWADVENPNIVSFDCSKGNIDTKITGQWEQNHTDIPHSRVNFGAFNLGGNLFCIGGRNYTNGNNVLTVDYYSIRRKKWVETFTLLEDGFNMANIDCVLLRVPTTNKEFSNLGLAMHNKWILW